MKTAIRKHVKDFIAIIALSIAAFAVGAFILSNQRFYLPNWVPVIGSDFVDYQAEMSTAQAFTAGQGQTVLVAGVPIGEIGAVTLKNGRARITMKVRRKYTPIYKDATILSRPKTGLNDMVLELDPGNKSSGTLPDDGSGMVPVANTQPNVNPDEFFAGLDTDTRSYLQLLLAGAGQGLDGNAANLAAWFKRFNPLARDLKKIGAELDKRSANTARAIHNFQLLARELARRDTQLARFVGSSDAVFKVFARQQQALRETVALAPATLDSLNRAVDSTGTLTAQLGPTLGKLQPTAVGLAPALKGFQSFAKGTTAPIRDQIRPFTRQAREPVKTLATTAGELKVTLPKLDTSFQIVNQLFNGLAYNPPGKQEGFLYWLTWANHSTASMFGAQDANGPTRRGIVFNGCVGLLAFEKIGKSNPVLGTIAELLGAPNFQATCPKEFAEQNRGATAAAAKSVKTPAAAGGTATPTAAAATVGAP